MRDITEPLGALGVLELVAANAVLLTVLLILFRREEPGSATPAGKSGCATALVASVLFAVCALVEVPPVISLAVWWAFAFAVLQLRLWQSLALTAPCAAVCWLYATPEAFDPVDALTVVALALVETVIVGGLLAFFRPGPSGYFAAYGLVAGWLIVLGVEVLFAGLAFLEPPRIVPFVLGWVVALLVYRLTVRQAIKFGIAQGLLFLLLVFCLAAVGPLR